MYSISILLMVKLLNIPLENFNKGGEMISFFISCNGSFNLGISLCIIK